jgi:hypothetical protein
VEISVNKGVNVHAVTGDQSRRSMQINGADQWGQTRLTTKERKERMI